MTTFVLAIDLGGTKVEAAVVSDSGEVRESSRARHSTGRESTPESLRAALAHVISHASGDGADIAAIGIGAAGPFTAGGTQIAPVNMPGLHGFALPDAVAELAQEHLGRAVPVHLGHDGGCLALAEAWLGATAGLRASMSIVVSTGIGGGIVIDGGLIGGAGGNAGHLGQTHIASEHLTLEEIASGPASVAWAVGQGWNGRSGEDLARDAAAGDPIARAAIVRSARAVGEGLADAVTLLDLEAVAIGGGFSAASADYIAMVQESLRDRAVLGYAQQARVVPSGLHGSGPLIGAAALALRALQR